MISSRALIAGVLLVSGFLSGCANQAFLYSHQIRPLMSDFGDTPVAESVASGDIKILRYYVEAEWGSNGIGDIAKNNGLSEIYYADLETITVLGYWQQNFVRVYGKPAAAKQTQ